MGRAYAEILLESMYQFVGLLDPEGILLAANRASIVAAGTRERDVIGRPFWDTPWWSGLPEAQSRLRQAIREAAHGAFVRYEVEHRGHGGAGLLTADFSLKPVRNRAGRVVYLVAEGRDITDRKRAETEVLRNAKELEALNAKLARADELKTTFFANVSHELRTPLALILGPLDRVLAGGSVGADARESLETAQRNARLLLKHVNDLLEISRIDAGKAEITRARVDLSELVRVTSSYFEAVARERGMRFEVDTPGPVPVPIDAGKIERVLLNLLANAFKFTPPAGTVRCALRAGNGRAILTVADSGPGVPASQREAIFERFVQADGGTARRHGGTGLGLAIARDFVALHGGSIRAGDAAEGGAQFTVELPLGVAQDAAEPREGSTRPAGALEMVEDHQLAVEMLRAGPAPPDRAGAPGEPLVLVVEDNPDMRRFIADALATRFRIATAPDGATALALALEIRPDLILTDVMMPGVTGEEVVRRVRGSDILKDVPIIALTARADGALRTRMIEEGALDYVTKPFSARELVARVSNLVALRRVQQTLQRHLQSRTHDLEQLTAEMILRNRELHAAVETAWMERDRAERANRAKNDFLGLVSHELLTPISAARLNCELLERDAATSLSARRAGLVHRTLGALERLGTAVRSLLQHVRIESGQMELRRRPVDIPALAAKVLEEVRPVAERKGLELRLITDPAVPLAETDERLLRLVLANLVSNAVKFTTAGAVRIVVSRQGADHRIAVEDSGPGIVAEDRARIFEPFHPGEPVSHKHLPGVGLGLALARQMAEVLGGSVVLEPHEGPGSTFVVTLPAAIAAAPRPVAP